MTSAFRGALIALVSAALLSACASPPRRPSYSSKPRVVPTAPAPEQDGPPKPEEIPANLKSLPDPVPQAEPKSRYGNPSSYEVRGKTYYPLDSAVGFRETGLASWYGRKFHGRKTSSGEPFDMYKLTAAHKTLPLPSFVRVTNLTNGNSIVVRVNDRGPFHQGRIIDLSYAAATKLDLLGGPAMVELEVITPGAPEPPPLGKLEEVASTQPPNYLQVAAYSDPINAVALRDELLGLGIRNIEIREGKFHQDTLHRVIVGPYDSSEALAKARSRLNAAGMKSIAVHY